MREAEYPEMMYEQAKPRRTRRQWRRDRPVLVAGMTGVEGVVKRLLRQKQYGYIQPKNNAARIRFNLLEVPYARLKCVEEGRTVFFTVVAKSNGRLVAVVT